MLETESTSVNESHLMVLRETLQALESCKPFEPKETGEDRLARFSLL